MTLFRHELRQGRRALAVWTGAVGFFIALCVGLYPQMRDQMGDVSALFAHMGAFTAAFGMDRLPLGTLTGFYAVECGTILDLGGGLFAALLGAEALAKEERGRTAEFLLTHPVGRRRVVAEKLAAVFVQLLALNAVLFALAAASVRLIGEPIPWRELGLLHLAALLMQLELGCVLLGAGAFLRRGSAAVGLGAAGAAYFLALAANISGGLSFLRWLTPFGYTDGAAILEAGALDWALVGLGAVRAALGGAIACRQYGTKDIR